MATYNDNEYASKGVGTAGLTLGVIGTALASGLLNGNGLGGILGGNQNPSASPVYQLASKDNEIAQLKAQQYSDNKFFALSEKVASIDARVAVIEKTEPLRDQIIGERVANLQRVLDGVVKPFVPNYAVAPGWGPAFVSPFPPVPPVAPIVNSGTTTTPTSTSTASAA